MPRAPRPRRARGRRIVLLLLALLLAWPVGLGFWANSTLTRIEALSGAPNTPGDTYLLVGSDSRADGQIADGTEGQRADTIILLNRAPNGQTVMVSLPRDTLVQIPGSNQNKLNSAYSTGGPRLLVQTVEELTGLTVDRYMEIGMGGVVNVVDAVGGVELCLDYTVNDEKSELVWEEPGCHVVDGHTALAFARMRYSDPRGDIGRAERQRQVIGAIVRSAATPSTLVNPMRQVSLASAGLGSLAVDENANILNLASLGLAFRAANGEGGLTGAPPIGDANFNANGSSVVLLADSAPDFFARLASGDLTEADFPQP